MTDWGTDLTSHSGLTFHVWPARPEDEAALGHFLEHVTPEDLRFRFLSSVKAVGHDQLVAMTRTDHHQMEPCSRLRGLVDKVTRFEAVATKLAVVPAAYRSARRWYCHYSGPMGCESACRRLGRDINSSRCTCPVKAKLTRARAAPALGQSQVNLRVHQGKGRPILPDVEATDGQASGGGS